jgi:hypothetical protein
MLLLLLLVISFSDSNRSPIQKLFAELSGSWSGHYGFSTVDDPNSVTLSNITARFTPSADFLLMLFTDISNSSSPSLTLYLKAKPNSTDILTVVDETADEFAELAFRIPMGGRDFTLRGIVHPQSDQITVSLEGLHLSIAITDQFSTNVTFVSLARKSSFSTLTRIGQIGIFVTVLIVIIIGLYKLGDISELVTPEESAETERIRRASRAQELHEKRKGKKEKVN